MVLVHEEKEQSNIIKKKNQETDPYTYKNSIYDRGGISDRKEKVTSQSLMLGQLYCQAIKPKWSELPNSNPMPKSYAK